jgi:hypothetical protein
MTDYTPTVEEVREFYSDKWDSYFDEANTRDYIEGRIADFDRMIAAVERAAAVKALRDFGADLLERVKPVVMHEGSGAVFSNSPKGDSTEFWSYSNASAYTMAVLEVLRLLSVEPEQMQATTYHGGRSERRDFQTALADRIESGEQA